MKLFEEYKFKIKHSSLSNLDRTFELSTGTIEFAEKPLYSELFDSVHFSPLEVKKIMEVGKIDFLTIDEWKELISKYSVEKDNRGGVLIDGRFFLENVGTKDYSQIVNPHTSSYIKFAAKEKLNGWDNISVVIINIWEGNKYTCEPIASSDSTLQYAIWPITRI